MARDESGFTLPELLTAMATMLIVATASFGLLTAVTKMQPHISERSAEIQQARMMVERVSRELRQGYGIDAATPTSLVLLAYSRNCGASPSAGSVECRITYSCVSGTCTRQAADPYGGASGPVTELVSGLASDEVFEPAVGFLGISISYPAERGDDAITLTDGVALRNAPASGA